jgi:hypothetical protein
MVDIPLTRYGAYAGLAVVLIAYTVAVWQLRGWVAPEPAIPEPDTVTVSEPLAPGELLDATTPDQVTEYDTSETRAECIEVPTWLASTQTGLRSGGEAQPSTESDSASFTGGLLPSVDPLSGSSPRAGPPYVITPLTSGSPRLSVGSEQVRLQGYLPTTRAGREWAYDIPQDDWGVGLRGDMTAGPWLHATATTDIIRYADVGPLDVTTSFGAGYGALITDEYRAGAVVTAGIRIGYDW